MATSLAFQFSDAELPSEPPSADAELPSAEAEAEAELPSARVFPVLVSRLASVTSGLDALAKRALRKGLTPVAYEVGKAYTSREHTDSATSCDHLRGLLCLGCTNIARVSVTLTGEAPCFDGWTFLAALQHLDGENLVHAVPGQAVPPQFRTRGPTCDHCKADRRRKDTFVVRHDDGRTLQVGSPCIRDFLGGATEADKLASEASLLASARGLVEEGCDEGSSSSSSDGSALLSNYLPIVAWCVEAEGWVSRTAARQRENEFAPVVATADRALTYLWNKEASSKAGVEVTDAHIATAAAAESWAESLTDVEVDAVQGSDYLHNVRAIARTGLVSHRSAGLAASMVV